MLAEENRKISRVWEPIVRRWRWVALVLAIVGLLGAIILLIHFATDINVRIILSDPAETALLPEYAGWYSNLGVLVLWSSSIFSFVSSRYGWFEIHERRRFVTWFAAILAVIAIDDLFMIHEWIGLKLAQLTEANDLASARSALEIFVFALYVLAGAYWVWRYRRDIVQSPWPLLALGLLGFAVSIGLDLLPYVSDRFEPNSMVVETTMAVLEDLIKLVGIGGLATYGYLIGVPHLQALTPGSSE